MTIYGSEVIISTGGHMERIPIYIDVSDTEFFERLGDYIRLNYSRYFKIVKDNEAELGFTITDYLNRRNSHSIITIKESGGDIDKFQKADDICISLLKLTHGDAVFSRKLNEKGPKVICVTSALGGIGKTTVAKALAKCALSRGFRVLYINTDPTSAGEVPTRGKQSNSLTKLHHILMEKDKETGLLLKSVSLVSSEGGYDCIVNHIPSPDSIISGKCMEKLIAAAKMDTFHDFIFIDFPSYLSESLLELAKGVSIMIVVLSNGKNDREEEFKKFLEVYCSQKIVPVINRKRGGKNGLPCFEGRVPSSEFINSVEDVFKSLGGIGES